MERLSCWLGASSSESGTSRGYSLDVLQMPWCQKELIFIKQLKDKTNKTEKYGQPP